MYVRWVVRKHKNIATANVEFHDAYLVESYRDDKNRPRQHTICYLGNIRQIDDCFPAIERELFLLRAERILASIPTMVADDQAQVIAQLRQKVPELTTDEVLLAFRNNMHWYRRWSHTHSEAPSLEKMLQLVGATDEGIGAV